MRISCSVEWLFIFFIIVIRFRSSLSKSKRKRKQNKHKTLKWVWFFRSKFPLFMGMAQWVEFVAGSLPCSERFFSGYSGFPLSLKTNISKFQFDQESGRRRTTLWMCYLQIVIYLFIYLFIYTHTMFSGTHPFGPNNGVPPLPRQWPQQAIQGIVNVNLGL